jgi:homoserine dehydrogenase
MPDRLTVAFLGFGNVGRALADLLLRKLDTLRADYDLAVVPVGVATGGHGLAVDPAGLDLAAALDAVRSGGDLAALHAGTPLGATADFIATCPADLVFETIPTNPQDGEPALSYDRALLDRGVHVATANKGPVAFGYRELSALARERGVGFFFESTVMDGAPVLAVGREGLPAARVRRVTGIFNSTTNYILTRMERDGMTFDEALREAQAIGIAETDPTLDVDGWDAAIKTVILANVLMDGDLRPADVEREGIRDIALADVESAEAAGERIRLLCEAVRAEDGAVRASVRPTRVPIGGVLAGVTGTTSIVDFETDTLHRLTILEHDPGPETTAYGLLADMVNIARGRHR